jgi:thioredoxin 1
MQVLYFTAPWCGPCKMFKPVVESASGELGTNINYINVDYDASLSEKYSVTSVPTIIILGNSGDVVYRNSGVMSRDQLLRTLNQFK